VLSPARGAGMRKRNNKNSERIFFKKIIKKKKLRDKNLTSIGAFIDGGFPWEI